MQEGVLTPTSHSKSSKRKHNPIERCLFLPPSQTVNAPINPCERSSNISPWSLHQAHHTQASLPFPPLFTTHCIPPQTEYSTLLTRTPILLTRSLLLCLQPWCKAFTVFIHSQYLLGSTFAGKRYAVSLSTVVMIGYITKITYTCVECVGQEQVEVG